MVPAKRIDERQVQSCISQKYLSYSTRNEAFPTLNTYALLERLSGKPVKRVSHFPYNWQTVLLLFKPYVLMPTGNVSKPSRGNRLAVSYEDNFPIFDGGCYLFLIRDPYV